MKRKVKMKKVLKKMNRKKMLMRELYLLSFCSVVFQTSLRLMVSFFGVCFSIFFAMLQSGLPQFWLPLPLVCFKDNLGER